MKRICLFFLLVAISNGLLAQQTITDAGLATLLKEQNNLRKTLPAEKLYLQTDKPYYSSGDTLRFKSYLLNGDFLTPSTRSGQLYIELANQSNLVVKRIMVLVSLGLSWGDIVLDEKEIPTGAYTLRAYTNWQRNFGEDYIFKKTIYIMPAATGATLVKAKFKLQQPEGKDNVQATLQFTGLDGHGLARQEIQLKVMNGKKNLSKDKITTGINSTFKVNFDVPDKTISRNLSIIAQSISKTRNEELIIPVILNRNENTDLQFMPEGGCMVAGIPAKIGFKALSEDGMGTNVNGKIYNSKQQQVAIFASSYAGMGSFAVTPQAGEIYTAKIDLTNGTTKSYSLPAISQTGTVLSVLSKSKDSLVVCLDVSPGLSKAGSYYLIGQARGIICYARPISFNETIVKIAVSKELFPTGIARFTLLNAAYQPLNERQVFIDHHDELQISIKSSKLNYAARDSIALNIQVKDKAGKPVEGVFSLAITDDSQVKIDSMGNNMLNNLLLTADLKGILEAPGYYFAGNKEEELDNLLLTQGWVGYDWKDMTARQPVYAAEPEFLVKGTVTNALGKPVEKSKIMLISNHPLKFKDTLSDKEGHFTFRGLFPVDTAIFKLQALNKHGKENNVRITMDEIQPPVFAPALNVTPWYVNSDTILLNNAKSKIAQLKGRADFNIEGKLLKEVAITDKKIIPGSKNLNGPGGADQVIDEAELEKAGKMTLGDLLQKKIKGFNIGGFTPYKRRTVPGFEHYVDPDAYRIRKQIRILGDWRMSYKVNEKEVHLIIDGINLDEFYQDTNESPVFDRTRNLFMKGYLDYFTAEDITGIELMYSAKYNSSYNAEFLSTDEQLNAVDNHTGMPSFAYIEITTRSKKGPFMQVTPGTYLYKTLAFSAPKQFYSPRYAIKNSSAALGTDLRSTIHWEPNVVTDKNGNATVSFYSSDRANNYTVVIEGSDMNGNIGSVIQKLVVNKGF